MSIDECANRPCSELTVPGLWGWLPESGSAVLVAQICTVLSMVAKVSNNLTMPYGPDICLTAVLKLLLRISKGNSAVLIQTGWTMLEDMRQAAQYAV